MAAITVSLEEFQQDAGKVSEASAEGPVFITWPVGGRLLCSTSKSIESLAARKQASWTCSLILAQARLISILRAWAPIPIGHWTYSISRACT